MQSPPFPRGNSAQGGSDMGHIRSASSHNCSMSSADEGPDDRLPQSLLDAIAPHGLTRSFPAHAILINEGDTTESL